MVHTDGEPPVCNISTANSFIVQRWSPSYLSRPPTASAGVAYTTEQGRFQVPRSLYAVTLFTTTRITHGIRGIHSSRKRPCLASRRAVQRAYHYPQPGSWPAVRCCLPPRPAQGLSLAPYGGHGAPAWWLSSRTG